MSISGALNNALSGLRAAGRASEVVANNISNALTPGYAPRNLELSASRLAEHGGVSIDGIVRHVDNFLLSDKRLASAQRGYDTEISGFYSRVEDLLGTPDEVGSLTARLSDFENALVTAASRPDAEERLDAVATAARDLTNSLNRASNEVQTSRQNADASIARQVERLNESLANVKTLNTKIISAKATNNDASSLLDRRQAIIDEIAAIVPVRVDARANGAVALYSTGGAILLDGNPANIEFTKANAVTADMTLANNALSGISINGTAIDVTSEKSLLRGGTLIAQFEIRDRAGVTLQTQLDAVARDLIERFADPSVDPTLGVGDPGLFTDQGLAFNAASETGLSARISLNALVDPNAGGDAWRIRDGLGAATPGNVGDATLLQMLGNTLSNQRTPNSGSFGPGQYSANGLMSSLLSQIAADRNQAERLMSFSVAQHDELVQMELNNGVDSDAELQRLILIEQAYAANARLIETADEMLQALLRI